MHTDNTVSFDNEKLILVDEANHVTGYQDKLSCHQGQGRLHRAFSILIFNARKELLLQKRSPQKMLWHGFWTNSCCSHPRKGETNEVATTRRLEEELGFTTKLTPLYTFQYQAQFHDIGSEHELCAVYIGAHNGPPVVNSNEISEWKYISLPDLEQDLKEHADTYTPWFKMEWEEIKNRYMDTVEKIVTTL